MATGRKTGGRVRGTPNRATAKKAAAIAASGLTPVDYMLSIVRNEKIDMLIRLDAAKAVAPYTAPRFAVIDARIRDETPLVELNDAARREKARQMILEAFAERQPLIEGQFRVVGGRDVAADIARTIEAQKKEGC